MIIDAHLHLSNHDYMTTAALAAGHENTPRHIGRVFAEQGIAAVVAMGSAAEFGIAPGGARVFYCASVRGEHLDTDAAAELERAEKSLADPLCVGLKLYPGYDRRCPADPAFRPFYELAGGCGKAVVFHTGDTAGGSGLVKYAHPLGVDEVAAEFRKTQFVLAHCGNPWIVDAVEVASRNRNAALDLSGLAVGKFDADELYRRCEAYWKYIRMWIEYLSDDSKIMYGSDWPLVNIPAYLELMRRVVPERAHEAFFSANARRIFRLP